MQSFAPSLREPRRSLGNRRGFSLVEVCLALGIVAFALIPLVGLLSVGLDSYRNSSMRARAAQAVSQIASSIRQAKAATDPATGKLTGVYTAAAPMDNVAIVPAMQWSLASDAASAAKGVTQFTVYFDANGLVTVSTGSPQMVAVVVLTPPSSAFDPGTAQIAVAWPAAVPSAYSATNGFSFKNPQGHADSVISFIPSSQ